MKSKVYKEYISSDIRQDYYICFENLTIELLSLIRDTKTEYHSELAVKLVNPSTSAKTYWSRLSLVVGKFQLYPHYWLIVNLLLLFQQVL